MADVLLFHHAHGLTEGVRDFAGMLRAAGHRVTAPDLYEGATFADLVDGVAHAEKLGPAILIERARRGADHLPADIVYAGFSLGVLPAQMLAQTRAGARGALLVHACVPIAEFGPWPPGVPVQIHAMDADELFVTEGDLAAARDLAASISTAELFLYPGDQHLFADPSLPSYDAAASELLGQRALAFLDRVA